MITLTSPTVGRHSADKVPDFSSFFFTTDKKQLQRTNGPVNGHLISENIQNVDKMAEKTLTLITNNPKSTYSIYNTNLIPGHRLQ